MGRLASIFQSFGRELRHLAYDRRAGAAVEFVLIFPVMILLYVGSVEMGNLLTIYRRTSQVASTAADLTAQVKKLTAADLKDVDSASSGIMTPYSTAPLKIVLTSVVADQNNTGKVDWSCAYGGGTARAKGSVYAVPTGLTEPGSSVIVSEVTYGFTPLVNMTKFFSPGSFDIKRTFYTRPRKSLTVAKTDGTNCP